MDPKDVVRAGYDRVSWAYRRNDFTLEGSHYGEWLPRFTAGLRDGARVLDLGCGCGVPVARELARRFDVTGVDITPVQIDRARALVPGAAFVLSDMATFPLEAEAWDGVVAFFAIIHLPLAEQPDLIRRIGRALRPGGRLLATVGHTAWTGTESDWRGVEGATMYWSHADVATYRVWFDAAGLRIVEEGFKPEGDGGHSILLAERKG